nr:immunoglobulin heavy chain junction region [Mus musculus]MBK4198246.1 immunoglobulin heavy chain junction region [Mus musculus]
CARSLTYYSNYVGAMDYW